MSKVTLKFTCVTSRYGSIACRVQTQATSAAGVLLDMLVLHELEQLTRSLEDVLQEPLEWRACQKAEEQDGDAPGNELFELSLHFDQTCLVSAALLQFPASALPILANWQFARPGNLLEMNWRPVECTLCLGELRLTSDEQRDLGIGALLMIPESFEPAWDATLEIGVGALVLGGHYQQADDVFLQNRAGMRTFQPASGELYRVLAKCMVDTDALLKGQESLPFSLSGARHTAELTRADGKEISFCGSMLPIGFGQALLLESATTSVR